MTASAAAAESSRAGPAYALLAYTMWGVTPVYWKALAAVPAPEVLAHRVFWTLLLTLVVLAGLRRGGELLAAFRDPSERRMLGACSLLIGVNWLIFIWAVVNDRLLEASLGYYLNPLINVGLGMLLLGEHLRRAQALAIGIAAVGVAALAWRFGGLPWVSLALAGSFAVYGLLHKRVTTRPVPGLAAETAWLAPLALLYVAFGPASAGGVFPAADASTRALLVGSGVATALPLIWFASAARRMRLSTLGLFQYLAPTLSFLLAVFVYGEPYTGTHAFTFACIWTALALYSWDALRMASRLPEPAAPPLTEPRQTPPA